MNSARGTGDSSDFSELALAQRLLPYPTMDRISMIFALLSVAISMQGAATLGNKVLSMRMSAPQAQVAAAPAAAPAVVTTAAAPFQAVNPQPQPTAAAEPAPWIAVRSDIHAGISRVRKAAHHTTKHGHAR